MPPCPGPNYADPHLCLQDHQLQNRRRHRCTRLEYYKQRSEAICQDVVSRHRQHGIPLSCYSKHTSRIATSTGTMIRRGSIICTCAALSVQWPILQSTQLVIDYGTGFEAGFAFCWREWCNLQRSWV